MNPNPNTNNPEQLLNSLQPGQMTMIMRGLGHLAASGLTDALRSPGVERTAFAQGAATAMLMHAVLQSEIPGYDKLSPGSQSFIMVGMLPWLEIMMSDQVMPADAPAQTEATAMFLSLAQKIAADKSHLPQYQYMRAVLKVVCETDEYNGIKTMSLQEILETPMDFLDGPSRRNLTHAAPQTAPNPTPTPEPERPARASFQETLRSLWS